MTRIYDKAFQITTHVPSEQVDLLMRNIYSKENVYIIYYDWKSRELYSGLIDRYSCLENVVFQGDTMISWASASILDTTLAGMKILADRFLWNQYVLISGQDFPAGDLDYVRTKLDSGKSYVACWSVVDQPEDLDREVVATEWDFDADTPPDNVIFRSRFSSLAVHPGTHFKYYHHHDLMRMKNNFVIDNVRNTIAVSNNHAFKDVFIKNWVGAGRAIGFGQAWVALNRAFVDWLLSSEIAADCYFLTKQFLFPDESFFQTAVLNSPFRDKSVRMSVSLFDPDYNGAVNARVLEKARRNNQPFVRKLDIQRPGDFFQAYEKLVGRPVSKATPDYLERLPV